MHQRFCLLFTICDHVNNDIGAFFYTDFCAVQANIVILSSAPITAGVMLVVYTTALVLFVQAGFGAFFGFTVKANDPVSAEGDIRMYVGMDAICAVLKNIVGISANDDTGAFFS
jgi:hypothetical protein